MHLFSVINSLATLLPSLKVLLPFPEGSGVKLHSRQQ